MRNITINNNLNTIGGDLDDLKPEIMQPKVFRLLRNCGWRAVPWKRYVVLSFDIISLKVLSPDLTPKDLHELPPFMLFFTIQVVNTKTCQPIGKVFLKDSTPHDRVASCIKSFIRDLMRCEYFVVATVSRPIYFFQCVVQHLVQINSLTKKTDAHLYKVEHLKIVHVYDPINMLENTFIIFLKYALKFTKNKARFLATYDDCKTVMIHSTARNIVDYVFNNTNNITCAVRLFSTTFYHELQECISKGILTNIGSAEFCAFFDVLFDSLHGNMDECLLKINRGAISKISPHYQIWNKSLAILKSMRIADKSGTNIPLKNPCVYTLNDDYEHYEILNMIQVETGNANEIEKSMNEVLEKFKENNLEDGKNLLHQQNLKTVDIEYYNNNMEDAQNIDGPDRNKSAELKDVDDFCLTIENKYFNTEREEYNTDDCITLPSEGASAEIVESYMKKLYVALRNSENSDVKVNNVNGVINNNNLQQTTKKWKVCIDKYDNVRDKQGTEKFSVQHFDKNLSYLQYFVNDCVPKKITYNNKINSPREHFITAHQKTDNMIQKYHFNEIDYIDEYEIAYSKEAIVSDDSYKEHENIEYNVSNVDYKTNKKVTNNFQEGNKHSNQSTLDTTVVEYILVTLEFIRTRFESVHDKYQILSDIINYLGTFNIVDSNKILQENLIVYTRIINKSLEMMMLELSNNNPNDSEKDIASINLTIIREHLRKLKTDNVNNSQKAAVSDIPDFFSGKSSNKNETNPNTDTVCKNIDTIVAKILPKHSATMNEKTLNVEGAVQRSEVHVDLEKLDADDKETYPEINQIQKEFADESKMDISSEDSLSADEIEEVVLESNNQPYVLDAWQITINGVKKVFEFLQKKRFQILHTDNFNIDYVRHIINDIRKEHGDDTENTHQFTMSLLSPTAAPHIFDTVGTIILE